MRGKFLFIPLVGLVVAALACSSPAGGNATATTPAALFREDFSSSGSGWSAGSTDNGSADYGSGDFVIKTAKTTWFVWSHAGQSNLSNIHIEATVKNAGAADAAFGVMCDYTDGDNYYFLGFGADGFYAIGRAQGGTENILTSTENKWIQSDQIPQNAASYRLGADCGNGALTLYVDGKKIASVNDSAFTSGDVGVFAQSFDNPNAEVHFDDFVVTSLAATQ